LNTLGVVSILGIAVSFSVSNGWAWRFPGAIIVTQEELNQQRDRYWYNRPDSRIDEDSVKIAIIGDSHAIDLYYALYENDVPNLSVLGYPFECDNVLDAGLEAGAEKDWASECKKLFAAHLASSQFADADIVLFNERWVPGDHASLGAAIRQAQHANADAQIVIVGPKHQFLREPVDILNDQLAGVDINVIAAQYLIDRTSMDAEMRSYAADLGVTYIDLYSVMCPPDQCELIHDGSLTYFDSNHWTAAGSALFGSRLLASTDYRNMFLTRKPDAGGLAALPVSIGVTSAGNSLPVPAPVSGDFALVPIIWQEPENIEVSPSDGPDGAMEATTAPVAGHHRIRYWFDPQSAESASVRWPLLFGNNERFLIFIYNNESDVYGSIRLELENNVAILAETGGAVAAATIAQLDNDWIEIAFDFEAKVAAQGSQLILYPTQNAESPGNEALNFSFAPPDVVWKQTEEN